MRTLAAASFLLRRVRAEAGALTLIWLVVALTAFVFAAAPRVFALVADAALRSELADAAAVRRGIDLTGTATLAGAGRPSATLERQARQHAGRFPESVRSLIGESVSLASSPRFTVEDPPRIPTFLVFRSQSNVDDLIDLVAGRMPGATGDPLGIVEPGPDRSQAPEPALIEIALSVEAAEAIGIDVGDTIAVAADPDDALVPDGLAGPIAAEAVLVGTFAVADPGADAWFGDDSLRRARIGGTAERPLAFATGLVARDALADIAAAGLPFRVEWRYLVEPANADASAAEILSRDLRRMTSEYASPAQAASRPGALVLTTGLLSLVEGYRARRAASEAVLSIAVVGPLALAIGAIAMLALLLLARRRAALQLTRDRGASSRVILAAQTLEALVIAGSAAITGLLLAIALVPGRTNTASAVLAAAVGFGAAVTLVVPTVPLIRRRSASPGRDQSPSVRAAPRRLILEAGAIALAIAGVLLLRRRGLTIDESGIARFDPFLAAVPVLVGFAAAVILVRIYPYPVRALASLAARRRDLVPVLGLRTIGRRPSAGALPLLILMLAAAFGSFSATILTSVERSQDAGSWMTVGGDYRIDAAEALLASGAVQSLPGVTATAPAFIDPDATFQARRAVARTIRLHAVAVGAYHDLLGSSPIGSDWTGTLAGRAGAGTEDDPIPAIISRGLPAASGDLGQGDTFPVLVGGMPVVIEVVAVRDAFPGIPPETPFVVTSLEGLAAATPDVEPNTLYVRASEGALTSISRGDEAQAEPLVTSRYAVLADLRGSPLIGAIADGFRLAVLAAAVYAAIAVVGALTLSAARRTQDLAYLRTLGLSARQAVGVTVVEHGIPVMLALVPGIVAGVVVAALLEASLGLAAFVGPQALFHVDVDWQATASAAVGLAAGLSLLIAASAVVARRTGAIEALRIGEA